MIEELQVDGSPLALGNRVVRGQAGLLPTDGEVHRQSHAELFVVDLRYIDSIITIVSDVTWYEHSVPLCHV